MLKRAALSLAILAPVFWNHHIEAGDLLSHLYNAWLAIQLKASPVPGIHVARVYTNVLSDSMMEYFMRLGGELFAERLVVAIAVLTFFWGAFTFVSAIGGKTAWSSVPVLAMLAYGLVFRFGLLNFYLSTGISLFALGVWCRGWRYRVPLSAVLLMVACVAHPLPAVWAAGSMVYLEFSKRMKLRDRYVWLAAAGIFILLAMALLYRTIPAERLPQQVGPVGASSLTGVEQVLIYNSKYLLVAGALLVVWAKLLLDAVDRGIVDQPIFHLWILNGLVLLVMPQYVRLPQYQNVFSYLPQRVSLFAALLICAVIGGVEWSRGLRAAAIATAVLFFAFSYADERRFNAFEAEISEVVASIPAGARLATSMSDTNSRMNSVSDVADRQCIGRCFSYGNYEAATGQFRIRATGPNRISAWSMAMVEEIGSQDPGVHPYVVRADDEPIYSLCSEGGRVALKKLAPGDRVCRIARALTVPLW